MQVRDIANTLESWAPTAGAESYDNIGLLVGLEDMEVNGVLINLDMTEAVIDEAIRREVNMIVAHHPIWFAGRKRLNGEDYVSRTIMKAVKHDIALYAIHTNLDNIRSGVNQKICNRLGLKGCNFLKAKNLEVGGTELGSGMMGSLENELKKDEFLAMVKEAFKCGGIRYADAPLETIRKVAVCGGSGSFLTAAARLAGADAFVTADITYHKYFDNENEMLLLDIGHYESEQFTSELIYDFLSEKFPTFAVRFSKTYTNPVRYY